MSTSNKYAPINMSDIVGRATGLLLNRGIETRARYYRTKHGRNEGCELILTNQDVSVFGDTCKPRVLLYNSNNGTAAFRIQIGLFRLVCSNGLTIGTTIFKERVTHIQGPTFDSKMNGIEYRIAAAIESLNDVVASLKGLPLGVDITLAQEHALVGMLGYSRALTSAIVDALHSNARRAVDIGNLWGLYNVINEVIRTKSRSEYRVELINSTLMDDVINAYTTMMNPTPMAA